VTAGPPSPQGTPKPERPTEPLGRPPAGQWGRIRQAFRGLDTEQRLAALAALVVAGSVFLPWWRDPVFGVTYAGVRRLTFLEVALVLVAVGVLALLFSRAEGGTFHLPLSDGTLLAASGVWGAFLVLFRMLDPPTRTIAGASHDYGLRWGILLALAAAVTLAVAGVQTRRRHHRGQPEAVAADADAAPTALL
jgi:hypothetical protein